MLIFFVYNVDMTINPNRDKKKCSMCGVIKMRSNFYKDKNRVDSMSNYCKECTLKRNKKWRESNEYANSESALWTRRKLFYGITKDEFYEILEKQDNKCAICCTAIDKSGHVDHCHKTKKIRGILCASCNKGLGMFKDSLINLSNAIEYLKK